MLFPGFSRVSSKMVILSLVNMDERRIEPDE